LLPDNLAFAIYVARLVISSRFVVALGRYDDDRWIRASQDFHDFVENMGARVELEGMDNLRQLDGPAVFIANHMSTLETFYLPQIIHLVTERCSAGVSPEAYWMWVASAFLLLAYALIRRDAVFVALQAYHLVAGAVILRCCLKYRDQFCEDHGGEPLAVRLQRDESR